MDPPPHHLFFVNEVFCLLIACIVQLQGMNNMRKKLPGKLYIFKYVLLFCRFFLVFFYYIKILLDYYIFLVFYCFFYSIYLLFYYSIVLLLFYSIIYFLLLLYFLISLCLMSI